jgi:hypothetical protein
MYYFIYKNYSDLFSGMLFWMMLIACYSALQGSLIVVILHELNI